MVSVRTFEVFASRESPWWLLSVPELGIATQARYWGEAESMARDLIASWLDVPAAGVAVRLEKLSEPARPAASPWMHLRVWAEVLRARVLSRR